MTMDLPQQTQVPRLWETARGRRVLGVGLLLLGLCDLLFIGTVLLPRVRKAGAGLPLSQGVSAVSVAEAAPSHVRREFERTAELGEGAGVPVAPSPVPAEESAPPSAAAAPDERPMAETQVPRSAEPKVKSRAGKQSAHAEPSAFAQTPVPSPHGAVPTLAPLRFDQDSAELSRESEKTLEDLAVLLHADTSLHVTLNGHTDDLGSEHLNHDLSMKRAQNARAYLQGLGIAAERVGVHGHSSEQPADDRSDEASHSRNRRVEISF
jgi:outer membrane protein OmpA-like peptidoglycan-associated protein